MNKTANGQPEASHISRGMPAFTILIILCFCLAASFAAYTIIKENKNVRQQIDLDQNVNSSLILFEKALTDIEFSSFSYFLGRTQSDGNKNNLVNQINYARNIYDRLIISYARSFGSVAELGLLDPQVPAALDHMKSLLAEIDPDLPPDQYLNSYFQDLQVVRKSLPHISQLVMKREIAEKEGVYKVRLHLFGAVIFMGLAGLFLIGVLFEKMSHYERLYQQKNNVQDELESRMAAIEASKDGVGIADSDGRITYVNQTLAENHGYDSPQALIGRPLHVLCSPEQWRVAEADIFPVVEKEGYWFGTGQGLRKDGTEFPLDFSLARTQNGGLVWSARDHSELMQLIDTSQRRLAAIEAAGDGIGIIDKDGNLVYMNRALMDLHGVLPSMADEYLNNDWRNLYHEQGREHIDRNVLPVVRHKGRWKGEVTFRRRDNSTADADMTLTRLSDGGMIGTARDIADKKAAEKEKEDLQRQFFHAQRMESVGRLAGGIAHDFNNILASLIGYTNFILEDLKPDDKVHHFARQIMHGCMQARTLVEQILAFSRRRESEQEKLNLCELVSETTMMLKASLPATVMLDSQWDIEEGWIEGNASQLSQAVMNLFVNAGDAIESEHGTIEVRVWQPDIKERKFIALHADKLPEENYVPVPQITAVGDRALMHLGQVDPAHAYLAMSISDDGIGMDAELMNNIFEPFFTTKPLDKGTGLGLAMVMGVMAAHQGALLIESREGKGTTFTLLFPMSEEAEAVKAKAKETGGKFDHSGLHVLVAEDQESVLAMMKEQLGRMGCEVTTVRSAFDAIDELRAHPKKYDVILSDYMMPGMNGVEFLEDIKEDFSKTPFILMTGYSREKLENKQEDYKNLIAVLKKPIDTHSLGQALEKARTKGRKKAA